MPMPSLPEVIGYITGEADEADLKRVIAACTQRREVLGAIRAAAINVGAVVRTTDLTPKYLNALRGEVIEINGNRAVIRLTDEDSWTIVGTRFGPRSLTPGERATLRGVPLTAMTLVPQVPA